MRIALVSPYSWTYPGGVTRHIEALAESFRAAGHHVGVLAPFDPNDRSSVVRHRGARPQPVSQPDYLIPLGRTIGIRANGAVSNVSLTPHGVAAMRRELRTGDYDVVHIHEPITPAIGWLAADWTPLPRVGTFHTYNEHQFSHGLATMVGARRMLNRLHVRIAVSQPAAWTASRFFGGRYRIIPNGVHFDSERATRMASRPSGNHLRIVFVGQPVERKGLPLLVRAFEALRERAPAELTVIGPSPQELSSLLLDDRGVHALGKVDEDRKRVVLEEADVLCAPSLGGESFGMVLTEAFASGTPVVASDIAGYRDVVRDGVNGILVPPGNAQALAEALYDLFREPARRIEMAQAAASGVAPFAWPRVAADVLEAYQDALATPVPTGVFKRAGVRVGAVPADLKPRVPARRLPSLEPPQRSRGEKTRTLMRRGSVVALSAVVAALAVVAVRKMGLHNITTALLRTEPLLAVFGLALMCGSAVLRGVSWHAVLRAALPRALLGLRDTMRALFVGVLVSSVLPASLGEPTRALIISRRTGRPWENLPIVLGTLMSQALLNIASLTVLGAVTFGTVDLFAGHETVLIVGAVLVPLVLLAVVLAPTLLGRVGNSPRWHRLQRIASQVRTGLAVFGRPRLATEAVSAQLAAWGVQCVSVYVLLAALHLDGRTGFLGAVAVVFAVNVTLLLPATPGDVGVFQAAVAAVLHAGWQVPYSTGVAFGVILQGVELAAALLMGVPAFLLEGLSLRQLTQRPADMAPVHLPPLVDSSSLRPQG